MVGTSLVQLSLLSLHELIEAFVEAFGKLCCEERDLEWGGKESRQECVDLVSFVF